MWTPIINHKLSQSDLVCWVYRSYLVIQLSCQLSVTAHGLLQRGIQWDDEGMRPLTGVLSVASQLNFPPSTKFGLKKLETSLSYDTDIFTDHYSFCQSARV